MTIIFNGVAQTLTKNLTLEQFLKSEQITGQVIVEYNDEVLPSTHDFQLITLQDGDQINIFRIVTGG